MKYAVFVASLFFFFLTTSVSANQSTDPSEPDFLAVKSSVDTVNRGGTGHTAKRLIERFIKKHPKSEYVDDTYLLMSVYHLHQNSDKNAQKWLKKLSKEFPESAYNPIADQNITKLDQVKAELKKQDATFYERKKRLRAEGRSLYAEYELIALAQTSDIAQPEQLSSNTKHASKTTASSPIKNTQMAQSSSKNSSKFISGLGKSNQINRKENPPIKSATKVSSNDSQKSHLTTQEKQQLIDSCQKESCYDEAKIAYRNNDLELSRDLYKKFLKENPNHRYTDWAKKSLRTIRQKLPPQQKIVRDSWGFAQGSPEQDAFYKKNGLGKYQKSLTYFQREYAPKDWSILSNEIDQLSKLRQNTKIAYDTGKLSEAEANTIVSEKFAPTIDNIGGSILANVSKKPVSLKDFNDTLISFKKLNNKLGTEIQDWRKSQIGSNSREYSLDLIGEKNKHIDNKESEYLRNYINIHIDIEDTIKKINDLAWNPIAPRELVSELLPALGKNINNPHLDKRIRNAVSDARKNQKQEFDSLPDSSAPKQYATMTIEIINKQTNVFDALEILQQKDVYYFDWQYREWPSTVIGALQKVNQKRRNQYTNENALNRANISKSDIIYHGGLVLGKSNLSESVNGYLTFVENNLTKKEGVDTWGKVLSDAANQLSNGRSTMGYSNKKNHFMGLFDDPYNIDIFRKSLSSNFESVCIRYESIQSKSSASDCLFFKDSTLVGFSLDRSSSECPSKCEYHNIDIEYFSKMGFRLSDESVDGIRLWRKHEKSNTKFNYRLWGGVSQYIKSPKKGLNGIYATQKANVCVFDKKIESILRNNEKEGAWTCS